MKSFRDCTIQAFDTTERCPDGCGHVGCPSCVAQKLEPLFRSMIVQEITDYCIHNHKATNGDMEPIACDDCVDVMGAIDTSYEDAIVVHWV